MNDTTLHSYVWLEIKFHYFQLSSIMFRFDISRWSRQLRICKYLIVLYTCAFLCDWCVFIASMFQNDMYNEPAITLWKGVDLLRNLALCCFQKNVLPHWLVSSTLQCIPLHHKMSGYEGMSSDILTICWFLISLPFRSIKMVLQSTIHSLCWWIV